MKTQFNRYKNSVPLVNKIKVTDKSTTRRSRVPRPGSGKGPNLKPPPPGGKNPLKNVQCISLKAISECVFSVAVLWVCSGRSFCDWFFSRRKHSISAHNHLAKHSLLLHLILDQIWFGYCGESEKYQFIHL